MALEIPRIDFCCYQLKPRGVLNSSAAPGAVVEGALLRVHGGYGCVQPWPALGDAPLDAQLKRLAHGELTPLSRRALDCCSIDGAARAESRDLFAGLFVPRSHATIAADEPAEVLVHRMDALHAEGYDRLKMKVGADIAQEARRVSTVAEVAKRCDIRLRLDFNNVLSAAEVVAFAERLVPGVKAVIDFVEDPCAFDASVWKSVEQCTGMSLALDRGSENCDESARFSVRVWKPACAPPPPVCSSERLVVTSYMDHAIGQVFAAFEAARYPGPVDTCGLLTHSLFEPDAFFEELGIKDTRLVPPRGPGLGFGAILEELPWKRLN